MPVNLVVGNDGSNTLNGSAGADLIYGYDPNGPQSQASGIVATRVATGLSEPLFATAPPGDTSRLFIVEKAGTIKILDLASGVVAPTPVLTLAVSTQGESGLLGLAFDPDFASNRFFYVYFTNPFGGVEIQRYSMSSSSPNVVEPGSGRSIITIGQTATTIHKAGWIGFGPDGDLYIASGDDANGANSQSLSNLFGKILRIDVHNDAFPADSTRNYAVPADNPFVGVPGAAAEIFAFGLRNPWRDSFDRGLGDFYIADVGQNTSEEVNLGQAGANYGWPIFEGPPGASPPTVAPIFSYNHNGQGASITGGYVYRGEAEALQGQYFFADFVQNKLFTLRFDGTAWVATDRTAQIGTDFGAIINPSSFGEDARGNLYITDISGDVFRLTPMVASADQADVLHGFGGNDLMFGGSGNDTLDGGPGADTLTGGPGIDTADYSSSGAGVTVNLATGVGVGGDAQGDVLTSIENIIGSAHGDTLAGDSGANTLAGGPGNDAYVVDAGDTVIENAAEGTDTIFSTAHFALPANVENLVLQGGADLQGFGNGLANMITGNSGNNLLDGGAGADAMTGGAGNDTYFVDNPGDGVVENANEGNDTVFASVNYGLTANVETLVLQGAADLQGFGNGLVNTLFGNTGNNLLDGGGGADAMIGGAGDDTYFVDNASDSVMEGAGAGNDAVFATANFGLSANVETLVLQGSADLQGFGNGLANALFGNTGNNLLDGGAGADAMTGRTGNDTYFVDNAADAVVENPGEGNDAVFASINYGLTANVETLVLQGSADLQGFGNGSANTLFGNSGNNLLDGSAGADAMLGGAGNDTYFVDNTADAVIEGVGQGTDAVFASVNYGLTANVETLVMQGGADLQGFGNTLANSIFGNSGNNLIDGGTGADTMVGGLGNDTYFVDDGFDQVVENVGAGTDAVFTTVHFVLSANMETLVQQGSADLGGTGNALANSIFGNSGNNTLDGQGAADVLTGNAGNDTFVFNIGQAGGDTVVDFSGNGTMPGDSLRFVGYGLGATFTQNDATHWQVNYNSGASHEIITFMNGAPIDSTDFAFI
jgi:Ca2+-binding RTX toxin-like protein